MGLRDDLFSGHDVVSIRDDLEAKAELIFVQDEAKAKLEIVHYTGGVQPNPIVLLLPACLRVVAYIHFIDRTESIHSI